MQKGRIVSTVQMIISVEENDGYMPDLLDDMNRVFAFAQERLLSSDLERLRLIEELVSDD